jgi:hypothetical protein
MVTRAQPQQAREPPIWLEGRCPTVQLMVATELLIGSPLRMGKPLHIHVAA